ncbi:hypothetical protein ASPZODRAFT_64389 [Penicilliopsis zonata CBS 506.65]|uniref:Uncharacterized protein n=1 Tax=Penicilliopsis zonata CBS 506.65 TaxID=1073090 RepID=A0A1L9SL78_9EURO|nr:hypothetical protein ASPZODRAFT_64389 [Penicilliopsis zonata CBS 506.65]OJJ48022.1 hypothetical protein ASPZODRAFT_64389 [Penicilliopsis zonata CBS 506.65]
MESVDLVIIGAGWFGLSALKTYRQLHPTENVLLVDSAASVGGVWAKERLYAGLKSNNMLGTYEFSDFPMDEATFGVRPGEHIPGPVIQKYLELYAVHFGVMDCIRLNTRVKTVEQQQDGGWIVTVDTDFHPTSTITTAKLIIATGVTSQPFLPDFPGQESFSAPLFHIRDLPQYESDLARAAEQDGEGKITVFGGTKSAWDAVYSSASQGRPVDWIIRASGHGPVWMAPPYVTPLSRWLEKLVTTRLLTLFSPCVWGDQDGFPLMRRLLHSTWLGRKIVDAFWWVLTNDIVSLNRYDSHPETSKLRPWVDPFWTATSVSILNYPTDFFALVRDGTVRVHIADIDTLEAPNRVRLSTGETLQSTALICATGWHATPAIQFLPATLESQMGFPSAPDPLGKDLLRHASAEILSRFPRLCTPPPPGPNPLAASSFRPLGPAAPAAALHPFRLARFIVPLAFFKDRSLAFLGVPMTFNTPLVAQTQALWATAYLDDRLGVRSTEKCPQAVVEDLRADMHPEKMEDADIDFDIDLQWETALHTEFGRYRYPAGLGKRNPDFVFDALPYLDLLLADLGIHSRRKRGLIADYVQPYGVEDYRGLVEEWKESQ